MTRNSLACALRSRAASERFKIPESKISPSTCLRRRPSLAVGRKNIRERRREDANDDERGNRRQAGEWPGKRLFPADSENCRHHGRRSATPAPAYDIAARERRQSPSQYQYHCLAEADNQDYAIERSHRAKCCDNPFSRRKEVARLAIKIRDLLRGSRRHHLQYRAAQSRQA